LHLHPSLSLYPESGPLSLACGQNVARNTGPCWRRRNFKWENVLETQDLFIYWNMHYMIMS